VVEWDGLENRCAGNCTEGSNPSLSAISISNITKSRQIIAYLRFWGDDAFGNFSGYSYPDPPTYNLVLWKDCYVPIMILFLIIVWRRRIYAPIPIVWWRAVYASTDALTCESFIDESAHKARKDRLDFRRSHLPVARLQALTDKFETVSDWNSRRKKKGWSTAIMECYGGIAGPNSRLKLMITRSSKKIDVIDFIPFFGKFLPYIYSSKIIKC
jgi:hypothetical protein